MRYRQAAFEKTGINKLIPKEGINATDNKNGVNVMSEIICIE